MSSHLSPQQSRLVRKDRCHSRVLWAVRLQNYRHGFLVTLLGVRVLALFYQGIHVVLSDHSH